MRGLIVAILNLVMVLGCKEEPRAAYLKGLNSCDVDSICIASYYFGERRDKTIVSELLTGLNDPRISHHIRHKGMSVYYCKVVALTKISGLSLERKQTYLPDSLVINYFVEWALKERLVDEIEDVSIESCTGQ